MIKPAWGEGATDDRDELVAASGPGDAAADPPARGSRMVLRRLRNAHPASAAAIFGRDTFWSTVGNVAGQGLSLCATVIAARLLPRQAFGEYVIFLSSVALLGTLAGLGLGIAISTMTAELRDVNQPALGRRLAAAYWNGAAVVALLGVLVVAGWALIGDVVMRLRLDAMYIALVVGTLGVNAALALQSAELAGYQKFRALAAAQCVRGLTLAPLSAAGAVRFGLPGVILAAIGGGLFSAIVQAVAIHKERKTRGIVLLRPRRSDAIAVFSCSGPAFLATVAQAAGFWGGNVAVASLAPGGAAIVAEYGAATQINTMILFFPNIVGQVLIPTVANRKGPQPRESRRLVRFSLGLNTGAALLLAAVLVFLRRPLALLFGPQYAEASGVMPLIAVGAVLYVAQSTISSALIGYGHTLSVTIANSLAALAFVATAGLLTVGAPQLGSRCLGWAYILSSAVQLLTNSARLASVGSGATTFAVHTA